MIDQDDYVMMTRLIRKQPKLRFVMMTIMTVYGDQDVRSIASLDPVSVAVPPPIHHGCRLRNSDGDTIDRIRSFSGSAQVLCLTM